MRQTLVIGAVAGAMLGMSGCVIYTDPGEREVVYSQGSNKQVIEDAFDDWRAGTGGPLTLLAPDATWTVAGNSLAAGRYESTQAFFDAVITPFNARLTQPLKPTVRELYAEGDTVVAHFDGEAVATDGVAYRNSYVWIMRMRGGQIVEATAFFDAIAFDAFWRRVEPK